MKKRVTTSCLYFTIFSRTCLELEQSYSAVCTMRRTQMEFREFLEIATALTSEFTITCLRVPDSSTYSSVEFSRNITCVTLENLARMLNLDSGQYHQPHHCSTSSLELRQTLPQPGHWWFCAKPLACLHCISLSPIFLEEHEEKAPLQSCQHLCHVRFSALY